MVSSFAIHHLVPERQRALYGEVFDRLAPGGVFANVEHVASTTARRHEEFLYAIGSSPENDDPSNKLVPVATHLAWLEGLWLRRRGMSLEVAGTCRCYGYQTWVNDSPGGPP